MAFFIALAIPTVVGIIQAVEGNARQNDQAKRAAEAARDKAEQDAKAAADRARAQADAERRAAEAVIQHQRGQLSLIEQILNGCRNGTIDAVPQLLQQLDPSYFGSLGNRPIAEALNEETSVRIDDFLTAERSRRGL